MSRARSKRGSLYLLPTCKHATSYKYASSFHSSSLFKELPRREKLCKDRLPPPHHKPTLVFFEVTMCAILILCLLVIALCFILQPNIFLNLCIFKLCACFLKIKISPNPESSTLQMDSAGLLGADLESQLLGNCRLQTIPQNAIPIPGRFLELESQKPDSFQFLERNHPNPIVMTILLFVIPIPENLAKEQTPCDSDSRN